MQMLSPSALVCSMCVCFTYSFVDLYPSSRENLKAHHNQHHFTSQQKRKEERERKHHHHITYRGVNLKKNIGAFIGDERELAP